MGIYLLYDHAKFDTQGGCRMVGVVPQIRISGVETTRNPDFGPSVEIENFPEIEPATTVPEDTYLTAMLSLHATNDHQSYLNHIVKILMYLS